MTKVSDLSILYEDNHLIAVNKNVSDIVQGDKTGDEPLTEKVKSYLKEKYNKKGNVYIGLPHRLDRPVSGIVLLAKTSKALVRLNKMFQSKDIQKIYWAIVKDSPEKEKDGLENFLIRNTKQNKSYISNERQKNAKKAILLYKTIAQSDRYSLLEVTLKTGRHHQIRAQLAHIGHPIKGDLKYGYSRSNPDKGISLHARKLSFLHPVKDEVIEIIAPTPKNDVLWNFFEKEMANS